MDPWIHEFAAGAAARAAAGAAAGAADSDAAVCISSCIYIGQREAPPPPLYTYVISTYSSSRTSSTSSSSSSSSSSGSMDPWIHGSISFIMNHIFSYEMTNTSCVRTRKTLKAKAAQTPQVLEVLRVCAQYARLLSTQAQ